MKKEEKNGFTNQSSSCQPGGLHRRSLDIGLENLQVVREQEEKERLYLTSPHERNTESLWGEAATQVTCPE